MWFSRPDDPPLSGVGETPTSNRRASAASQPAVMLFAHSETIPAFWRMLFSRSVSESSSQTIRIRAPSGTFNVKLDRVLLSPVISRVRARRIIPRTLHSWAPVHGLTHIFHPGSPETVPIAWEPLWFKRQPIEPGPRYVLAGRRQSHSALPRNVSRPP